MFEYSLENLNDSIGYNYQPFTVTKINKNFCTTCNKNILSNCTIHLPQCPYSCKPLNATNSDGLLLMLLFIFIYALVFKKN